MSQTNQRKIQHIEAFAHDAGIERAGQHFDRIHLSHRALPECNLADVSPQTTLLGKTLSFPFLISSMTGGDHPEILKINQNLAKAAEQQQVALAVGSQRVLFKSADAQASFALREWAPNVPLIANIGAVQLNYELDTRHFQQAMDVLEADAIYLHLNALQEAVQPEGDTDFTGLIEKMARLRDQLNRPVWIKEVGCGFSKPDLEKLVEYGFDTIDVAGHGGTSWSRVEQHRGALHDLGLAFQDWGIPTPRALRNTLEFPGIRTRIASGGIRNGLDMIKCVIIGANLCGVAAPLLTPALDSGEKVATTIERFQHEFRVAMFLLGCTTLEQLSGNESLIEYADWY